MSKKHNKSASTTPVSRPTTGGKSIKTLHRIMRPKVTFKPTYSAMTRCIRAAGLEKAKHRGVYKWLYHMMRDDVKRIVGATVTCTKHAGRLAISMDDLRQGLKFNGIHLC